MELTSRERIILTLQRKEPDRVPTFEWLIDKRVIETIAPGATYEEFVYKMGHDALCVDLNYRSEKIGNDLIRDEWGMIKKYSKESHSFPVDGPIKCMDDIASYTPPIEPFPFSLWDPLGWEQSLIVNVKGRGLVVITGCGHPSLERIIERAEAVFTLPVVGVVGGLHYLKAMEEDLTQPIEFLALRNPQLVALSPHDSSGEVLQIFEAAFPKAYRYICIGVPIELP